MEATRSINTPSYGGKEYVYVKGSLEEFLSYYQTNTTETALDLFIDIAWAAVTRKYPTLENKNFNYQLRSNYGNIEVTLYRRD